MSVDKLQLMGQLAELLPPKIADAVMLEYAGMSERVATAGTPGKQAYPSQMRTGQKRILLAMGVREEDLRALDRQIRIEHGGTK